MLRRVKQYMALLTDPPKKAVLLECGHTAQITDGKIYLKGYWFDCPYCGEEGKHYGVCTAYIEVSGGRSRMLSREEVNDMFG